MKREAYQSRSTRGRPQREVDPKAALVCARKHRHPDEATARAAAARSIARHDDTAGELYVYRCEACFGWHLTRFKVGIPVKADNPVSEDWREGVLAIAREGHVQSYRNCEHGDRLEQKWLHEACLMLEQEGKLKRHFEREHAITWVVA